MTPDLKRALVKSLTPIVSRVRTDVTALKVADGSSRWTTDALTTAMLEHHVNGGPARGVCPIREGESVTMLGLLDLDSHKGATSWGEMVSVAADVADALSTMGYEPIAFRSSGGRGVHIYVIWDTPQDAHSVRQALTAAIESCGYVNGAKGLVENQIEVFPKQSDVAVGGFGNQFILPLAGASEPLDLGLGICTGKESIVGMAWPTSTPVPDLERPARVGEDLVYDAEPIEKVSAALAAIKNDGPSDYDWWRNIGFAVHEATGGSEEGREVFMAWSAQNDAHDETFATERVWGYIKPADKRGGSAVTRATLYGEAMKHGWGAPTPPSADGFEDALPAVINEPASEPAELPGYERTPKGEILTNLVNVVMACMRPDICGWRIGHDEFRDELMVAPPGVAGDRAWRAFSDADYTRLRTRLHRHGIENVGSEMIKDAVYMIGQDNRFDAARLWINGLHWDGVPRVASFMATYMGAEDNEYTLACSLYMWTALAGRVLDPGCQADMVPIFMGTQGLRKTSAVKAMSPSPDFFGEIDVAESDDNMSRKMRGKLIAEIGELRGLRVKEQEAVKAFITRTHEEWVPKYKEFGTKFARRMLFIGTTNQEQFLGDKTGNRRWLPLRVSRADTDGIERDVLQLWAEARDLWLGGGVRWQEAERLARAVHGEHEFDEDPWVGRVANWLESSDFDGKRVADRPYLTTEMILVEAVRMELGRTTKADQMRAGEALRELGYKRKPLRIGNRVSHVYVATLLPPDEGEVAT